MAKSFNISMLVSVLVWCNIISTARSQFKWCYFFHGECLQRCHDNKQPLGTYNNRAIQMMLCQGSGWCCPKSYIQPSPKMAPTTTPPPTTTTTPPQPQCGIRGFARKIIGGIKADYCEFKYMVYIDRTDSPCGGTLIDDRHILTAAHCVWDLNGFKPVITVGEYNRSRWDANYEYNISNYKIFIHGSYSDITYENDIAILRLDQPVDFNKYQCLQQICLPDSTVKFPYNTVCTTIGWGVTRAVYDVFNPPLSDVLLKVSIPIVDHQVCKNIYNKEYYKQTNICAGDLNGGKDSCGGDSGGPLICTRNGLDYVAGIVSAGIGCAQKDTAAIYTDVSSFSSWIESIKNIP